MEAFNQFKKHISEGKTFDTTGHDDLCYMVEKEKILANKDIVLSGERYIETLERLANYPIVKLGEVIDLIMGQAPLGEECNKEGLGTPFVKVGQFGEIKPIINEWTTKPLKFANEGDVLLCVVGATIGKLNLGIECAIGRSVASIRPKKDKLKQVYLYHLLKEWTMTLREQSQGSAQGVIGKEIISEIEIPLPPLEIQEEIVKEIEGYQKEIEDFKERIELKEKSIFDKVNEVWGIKSQESIDE